MKQCGQPPLCCRGCVCIGMKISIHTRNWKATPGSESAIYFFFFVRSAVICFYRISVLNSLALQIDSSLVSSLVQTHRQISLPSAGFQPTISVSVEMASDGARLRTFGHQDLLSQISIFSTLSAPSTLRVQHRLNVASLGQILQN
jgi:hypothetical protein